MASEKKASQIYQLIIIFCILAFSIGIAGYVYYQNQKKDIRRDGENTISAIADLKVEQIKSWRKERVSDASFIFNNPNIAKQLEELREDPSSMRLKREILSWLTAMHKNRQYTSICLATVEGKVLISVPEDKSPLCSYVKEHLNEALLTKKILFSDFYKDDNQDIFLDIVVPISIKHTDAYKPSGAAILRINPRHILYPLIQSWPTPSKTAETLLVRREGDSVLCLNDLLHRKNTALTLRVPLNENRSVSAMAARGIRGSVEGIDYRGMPVLAAIRPVPDSSWLMIAKIDREEIYSPYASLKFITILIVLLISFAGLSVVLLWRHQQVKYYARQYEMEHKEKEFLQKYEHLTRYANDIILLADGEGIILDANERAVMSYGYGREELLALSIRDLRTPEARSTLDMVDMDGHIFETVHQRKDGQLFPVEVSSRSIEVEGRMIYQHIIRDITERKNAERALQESEAKYRTLFEESRDVVFIANPEGCIIDMNQAGIELFGYGSKEEMPGVNLSRNVYCDPADRIKIQHLYDEQGFVKDYEVDMRRKDGEILTVLITATAVKDRDGKIVLYRGMLRDITNQKKLEAQLLQSQKMEAIGQLAGGIAHDFNNILTAVIGYAHILKMKMKEDDPLKTFADHILSLSDRAANLTQSLLAFSRKQIMNPRPLNLNEIIRTVERLLFRIIGEDIQLRTELSERDLIIMADHVQIEQVLMNLATNARDAMPRGGRLIIGTETAMIDHEFISEHGFGREGEYALVTVTDTGGGMERETTQKIFEPFFTTKEVGKGTGLGLAMVYGTIRQHDGYINVYSEPGQGTTFRIYLPLIQTKIATEEARPEVPPSIATGTETILLAEDEAEVREFTKKLLEDYGYTVIESIDGEDAIGKFELYKDKIQLVLLDVIMPNRNGREVYEAIQRVRPDIKVLFISGYPADHIDGIIAKGSDFILKPVSPTKLLQKIREVLEK